MKSQNILTLNIQKMTIFQKIEEINNYLLTTVNDGDFKQFILDNGGIVDKSKINYCIDSINNFTEKTNTDCVDTIINYQNQLLNDYQISFKNCFTLSNQFLCYQIYENLDTLRFSEEIYLPEKIINMYRRKRLDDILSDDSISNDF